jgi:hypothetical protein
MKNSKKLGLGQTIVRLGMVGIGLYLLKSVTDKMVENYEEKKKQN